jgi:hypothetical protein
MKSFTSISDIFERITKTSALHICYGSGNYNGITISLIFLIVISMVLPTSAIMYASGQSTDNSDDLSGTGESIDNSGSSSTGGGSTTTTDNSGSSSTGGSAGNSATYLLRLR